MVKDTSLRIVKRCPKCDWRIFDKVTPTTGIIEMKCPNCGRVIKVDLSFRRQVKYRRGRLISKYN